MRKNDSDIFVPRNRHKEKMLVPSSNVEEGKELIISDLRVNKHNFLEIIYSKNIKLNSSFRD